MNCTFSYRVETMHYPCIPTALLSSRNLLCISKYMTMFIHSKMPVCMVFGVYALDLSDGCTNSNQRTRRYNYITYIHHRGHGMCMCSRR